jgi:hypothetical protein
MPQKLIEISLFDFLPEFCHASEPSFINQTGKYAKTSFFATPTHERCRRMPQRIARYSAAGELPPLVNVRLCALFHDLVHHMLHRDWHRALDIGEIWIDVKLVQQRIVAW